MEAVRTIVRPRVMWFCILGVLLIILQVVLVRKVANNMHIIGTFSHSGNADTKVEDPVSSDDVGEVRFTEYPKDLQVLKDDVTCSYDQLARLKRARDLCATNGSAIPGGVGELFVYEAQEVAYCPTHKIASTFWVRLFRWLYDDTPTGHVASPLDISKFDTHLEPLRRLRLHDMTRNAADRQLVESSYRFLFTREPFARLWSVYVDKFVLPDYEFWTSSAWKIKQPVIGKIEAKPQETWESHVGVMQKPSPTGNATSAEERTESNSRVTNLPESSTTDCVSVSFPDFLQHVVKIAKESSAEVLDGHVRPVHYGCNPCLFRPDFIGNLETMKQDSLRVLQRMRLDDAVIAALLTNHVQHEISMLTEFCFGLVPKVLRDCVSDEELERRLIRAFTINGYIPENSEALLADDLPLGQTNLEKAVLKLYEDSNRTSSEIREQRQRQKAKAYAEVSTDVLRSLQEIFYWDFKLFGYDPHPSEIFGSR